MSGEGNSSTLIALEEHFVDPGIQAGIGYR